MNDIAISARGLGKRYRLLGKGGNPDSLRDVISGAFTGAFSRASQERAEREAFWALKDASFDIRRGENVGIIGLNGAGKSTLLKVLSRIVTPTTGEATITGRLGALLEVGTGFHPELTGRENAFLYGAILGMPRSEVARKFDAIVDFRRDRRIHRHAGEALFERHVCAPRLRGGRAPRPGHPAARRSAGGGRLHVPAQVHELRAAASSSVARPSCSFRTTCSRSNRCAAA